MYQNRFVLILRKVLRKLGLTVIIGKFLAKKNYEQLFDQALLSEIQDTDIVFDIGANQGYYTKKFLDKVTKGKVLAFEPVPGCVLNIKKMQPNYPQLTIFPIALGSEKGAFPMSIGNDSLNATSSIKTNKESGDIMVSVESIDNMIASGIPFPNVLKIDVEGFELEVLKGMKSTIKKDNLRLIAMEIHFNLLDSKGYRNGSKSIVNILKENRFKINWIDHSHIIAKRMN